MAAKILLFILYIRWYKTFFTCSRYYHFLIPRIPSAAATSFIVYIYLSFETGQWWEALGPIYAPCSDLFVDCGNNNSRISCVKIGIPCIVVDVSAIDYHGPMDDIHPPKAFYGYQFFAWYEVCRCRSHN